MSNLRWRLAHPAARAASGRRYRLNHKAKLAAYLKAWRQKNREKSNAYARERYAKQKIRPPLEGAVGAPKLSIPRVDEVPASLCELCNGVPKGRSGRTCFDHDHETGEFRGWICGRCNLVLGLVKDDTELLDKMIVYLFRSRRPKLVVNGPKLIASPKGTADRSEE